MLRVKLASESRCMLEHFVFKLATYCSPKVSQPIEYEFFLQYRLGSRNISELSTKQITEAKTIIMYHGLTMILQRSLPKCWEREKG